MYTTHPVTPARLLIHAHDDHPPGRHADSPLQRLLALYPSSARSAHREPLRLLIDTLEGETVLAVDDAGPLVDVSLPPGTYHVTAHLGDSHRGYTMRLDQGASFDLHLRLAKPVS
ncbi:MAG: hypothetical protein ABW067_04535 [Rhizobacter sp.]